MTRSTSRTTKRELTLGDLASATRQSPRSMQYIITQFEWYSGIEFERIKHGRTMTLRFTPDQFQFMRRAVDFVRDDKGTYLDFFKLHAPPRHRSPLSENEPFVLTTRDWRSLLNRVEGMEQQLTAIIAQLEAVRSVLPEKRRPRKKKVPE